MLHVFLHSFTPSHLRTILLLIRSHIVSQASSHRASTSPPSSTSSCSQILFHSICDQGLARRRGSQSPLTHDNSRHGTRTWQPGSLLSLKLEPKLNKGCMTETRHMSKLFNLLSWLGVAIGVAIQLDSRRYTNLAVGKQSSPLIRPFLREETMADHR